MANAAKRRGDSAEREAAALLSLLLARPIRRKLGAGRQDDQGDLDGLRCRWPTGAMWPARPGKSPWAPNGNGSAAACPMPPA